MHQPRKRVTAAFGAALVLSLLSVSRAADPKSAPAPPPPAPATVSPPAGATPAATPAAPAPAPAVAPAPAAPDFKADTLINHLNAMTRWYREIQAGQQWVRQPADEFFWRNDQISANEAVRQAFAWANAEAPLVPEPTPAAPKLATPKGPTKERIAEVTSDNAARIGQLQSQITALDQQINAKAAGEARDSLIAQKGALVSALQLTQEFQDYIGKAQGLMAGAAAEEGHTTLKGEIAAMQLSVKSAFDPDPPKDEATGQAPPNEIDSPGMLRQLSLLYALIRNMHELDAIAGEKGSIASLQNESEQLRAPVRLMLRDIVQHAQTAATEIENTDPDKLPAKRKDLEALASNLKQLSQAALALRAEQIALEQNRSNLLEWREVIARHRDIILRALAARGLLILVVLGILFITSELWRRATFRYVQDLRRRRQLLLVRRFAYGTLILTVLIMGLVSNLSSLATFAGFITAGIAVASQTIIVSIAAFFFMVGKNGVHVGDRVTVTSSTGAQVTGKVVEIDLVRFSIMELTGSGNDLHPTGRIASYANSVLFQTVPFFKHITGTDYGWHEIALTLTPEADYDALTKAVLVAVNSVYAEYRKALQEQAGMYERERQWSIDVPEPSAQVRYGEKGPELVAGFPADRTGTIGMDLRVSNAVKEALAKDPELAKSVTGEPQLRRPGA